MEESARLELEAHLARAREGTAVIPASLLEMTEAHWRHMTWANPTTSALRNRYELARALQRMRLNDDLPIARIPNEILRVVFHYHAIENDIVMVPFGGWTTVVNVDRTWFGLTSVPEMANNSL